MNTAILTIADVVFAIDSDLPLQVDGWGEVYCDFLNATPPRAPLWTVRAHVRRGVPDGLARARRRFDGQRSWSALADGDTRWFVHAPNGPADIEWAARLSPDQRDLEVGRGESPECPLRYPLDQVLLMYLLATRGGLLLHAAGVVIAGRLYLLAGRSGAGKSTLSRLLVAAGIGPVLSDDRMVVQAPATGGWQGYGTPWPGTERIARAGSAPLAGILLIEHGHTNQPEPQSAPRALKALLPLASVLWHEEALVAPALDTAARLAATVPVYRFACTPDTRAVEAIRELAR